LLELAAAKGHSKSQYHLGVLFANGRGVARDEAKAAIYYQLAVDQGNASAQNNLA
jgi:TPR repeat protein